ncbi:hypothetical protein HOY34_21330 [Xinfangfangia sp. D13-10-4-6]|nr:hypothetical protein [Pseudogemmobacter hezensis]NPD17725.1 hypothetical protein [Pseudogemmobacter hezensis]
MLTANEPRPICMVLLSLSQVYSAALAAMEMVAGEGGEAEIPVEVDF